VQPVLDSPPVQSTARLHYGWVVLGLVVLSVFGSLGLARFGYTTILPAMQDGLKLSNTQTGELQSWNLLGYMLTVLFAGILAAQFGPRQIIALALLLTSIALIVTGLIPTYGGARFGRFLAGVGGAGANVPSMALISAWFGARRRGLASGIGVAGSSVGLIVTGLLVPAVQRHYGVDGWRNCWYLLGGMALVVSVLSALFLRNTPEEKHLTAIAETRAESTRRQAASRSMSVPWSSVWRSGVLWHLAVIYFAFGFSYIIYSTFFVRYLVSECHFSPANAGLLWSKIGLVSGVSGLLWGSVSDRWGRGVALQCVFLLQGASFVTLGVSHEWSFVYASAGLFAVTAWSIPALMAALAGDVFGARLAPAALGLVTIVFGLGQTLGPYAGGRIADTTGSFSAAFVTAGVMALAFGAGGALFLRRSPSITPNTNR
jgi:MFS family permease